MSRHTNVSTPRNPQNNQRDYDDYYEEDYGYEEEAPQYRNLRRPEAQTYDNSEEEHENQDPDSKWIAKKGGRSFLPSTKEKEVSEKAKPFPQKSVAPKETSHLKDDGADFSEFP